MGKKRIIAKSEEEILKVETKVRGEFKVSDAKIKEGIVYVSSSYNNTIITLTDREGNVLSWLSAGSIGFKGTKKSTSYAASKVAEMIAQSMQREGIYRISIKVKGIGAGKESAIRSLAARGLEINSIEDITPIPHNGCRPPKPRRV